MSKLYNLARVTTATTGTGTITLGSAVSGFLTFAQAGVSDGDAVSYAIADGAGSEIGIGTYTASGTTLTRDTILRSTGSGNNTAISLSGAAQVFITAPAEALDFSRPNIVYNSAMEIDQAREGVGAVANGTYIVDGWLLAWVQGGTGPATLTSVRDTTVPKGFSHSLKSSLGAAYTGATGAGDYWMLQHRIEGSELIGCDFGLATAQPLSLSFWLRTTISGTWGVSLRNDAVNRSYVQNVTTVANTWKLVELIFPGDTGGAWVTSGTALGMYLSIAFAAGSTFQGTAGSWSASNILATSSQTQLFANANAIANFTGVDLKIGAIATPYKLLPFSTEFIRCQRHYEKSYAVGTAVGSAPGAGACTISNSGPVTAVSGFISFTVRKRVSPTMTIYDGAGTSGKLSFYDGSWKNGGAITVSPGSMMGVYVQSNIASETNQNYEFTADARL